jgi:hypothetical protein
MTNSDKHSSLLQYGIDYGCKNGFFIGKPQQLMQWILIFLSFFLKAIYLQPDYAV